MAIDPNIQKVIIRKYEANEPVIKLGVDNDRFYVVLQGRVEVKHLNNKIRLLKDGDVFGIEYYYLENPYSITATTVTRSRIASYHVSMIREIIYDHPRLVNQLMASLAKQLEQTTLFLSKVLQSKTPVEVVKSNIPKIQLIDLESEHDIFNFHDDILKSFITESRELINELLSIGNSLKHVEIPNEEETKKLMFFAQKLNRLIGGTASMGFKKFACLSRKTSLLAQNAVK
jgi:CRP-like cAMP-binding protein